LQNLRNNEPDAPVRIYGIEEIWNDVYTVWKLERSRAHVLKDRSSIVAKSHFRERWSALHLAEGYSEEWDIQQVFVDCTQHSVLGQQRRHLLHRVTVAAAVAAVAAAPD